LLDVTPEDVQRVAHEFLVEQDSKSNVAVLGEQKEWVKPASGWQIREVAQKIEQATSPQASEEVAAGTA
jgi:hypothetical protein